MYLALFLTDVEIPLQLFSWPPVVNRNRIGDADIAAFN